MKIKIKNISVDFIDRYSEEAGNLSDYLNMLIIATNSITQIAESVASGNMEIIVKKRSEDDRLMQALVNPNKKPVIDNRTPEELLEIIEAKGKEISALAVLRRLKLLTLIFSIC